MLVVKEIHPLTDFLRHHRAHLERLKTNHALEVLTVNGKAEIVVIDFESFQQMVIRLNEMETIEAIREGMEAVGRGEMKTAREVFDEMQTRLQEELQAGVDSGFAPLDMAEIKAEARRRFEREKN